MTKAMSKLLLVALFVLCLNGSQRFADAAEKPEKTAEFFQVSKANSTAKAVVPKDKNFEMKIEPQPLKESDYDVKPPINFDLTIGKCTVNMGFVFYEEGSVVLNEAKTVYAPKSVSVSGGQIIVASSSKSKSVSCKNGIKFEEIKGDSSNVKIEVKLSDDRFVRLPNDFKLVSKYLFYKSDGNDTSSETSSLNSLAIVSITLGALILVGEIVAGIVIAVCCIRHKKQKQMAEAQVKYLIDGEGKHRHKKKGDKQAGSGEKAADAIESTAVKAAEGDPSKENLSKEPQVTASATQLLTNKSNVITPSEAQSMPLQQKQLSTMESGAKHGYVARPKSTQPSKEPMPLLDKKKPQGNKANFAKMKDVLSDYDEEASEKRRTAAQGKTSKNSKDGEKK